MPQALHKESGRLLRFGRHVVKAKIKHDLALRYIAQTVKELDMCIGKSNTLSMASNGNLREVYPFQMLANIDAKKKEKAAFRELQHAENLYNDAELKWKQAIRTEVS